MRSRPTRAGPSARSGSSCRSRPAAAPIPSGGWWRRSSLSACANRSWSKTASAAAAGIGSGEVAHADADGYTLGLANTSTHAVAASVAPLSYDPVKDFAPVSMLGHSPFVLALYPGVPAHSVQELIALARAKPRVLNYASAGPATLAHLSGALFEKMAKIELTHVPYRGTAQSTLDLLEGRVEMQFGTIPPTLAHIRAGKLRALAVTGAVRNPTLPDVPTIAEFGLPGYECSLWQAIVAPAVTSPPSLHG